MLRMAGEGGTETFPVMVVGETDDWSGVAAWHGPCGAATTCLRLALSGSLLDSDRGGELTYDDLFLRATQRMPFPYQRALALSRDLPEALSAPTGTGKTAAVVLGWLYRRRFAAPEIRRATPRRLVLCLPMRTLATQTTGAVTAWLRALALHDEGAGLGRGDRVGVHLVMGGHALDDWHLHPERDAVLVGTQDMLLSRALNRGYGQSRFLWPWLYALFSALAVFRLITSSNVVGCSTGRSPGLAPLSILST